MLNWIGSFVSRWRGRLTQDVLDVVHWTVHALASVVYTVFGNVGKAWRDIIAGGNAVIRYAGSFTTWAYHHIWMVIEKDLPWLWHILLSDVKGLLAEIGRVYNDVRARILAAVRYAEAIVAHLWQIVLRDVYHPLLNYAKRIESDLLKWGYAAWQLVTDPPKLAAILLGALIASAESAFWSIAAPAGRFAFGVILHNAGKFVSLMETILTAVL